MLRSRAVRRVKPFWSGAAVSRFIVARPGAKALLKAKRIWDRASWTGRLKQERMTAISGAAARIIVMSDQPEKVSGET
jgi:hypothetical protein